MTHKKRNSNTEQHMLELMNPDMHLAFHTFYDQLFNIGGVSNEAINRISLLLEQLIAADQHMQEAIRILKTRGM